MNTSKDHFSEFIFKINPPGQRSTYVEEMDSIRSNLDMLHIEIGFAIWLDKFSERVIREIKFYPNSGQHFLSFALYLRMHNSHKAIIREAIMGFWTESECIARPLFETLILLSETIRDPDFVHQYILSQNRLVEDMTNKYVNDQRRDAPQLIQIKNLNPGEILSRIKIEGKGEWSLEKLAEKNGLTLLHDQIYKTYHNSVHVKPNSINRHFLVEGDEVKSLIARPLNEFPVEMINTILLTFADGLKKILEFFDQKDFVIEIQKQWELLHAHSLKTAKK